MLDSRVPTAELLADSHPGYHDNRTVPTPGLETSTSLWQSHDDPTRAVETASTPSSSQAPPTPSHTAPPDWLTSVASVSTLWSTSSTPAPQSGQWSHWSGYWEH